MEVKKSPRANLENKRVVFLEIGFIFALSVVFCAFQYSSYKNKVAELRSDPRQIIEEEDIPATFETSSLPLPPPEQFQIPIVSDIIDIVDNDIKIENNIISYDDHPDIVTEIMKDYNTDIIEENIEEESVFFTIVQESPLFMGGDAANFSKWVDANLRYPEIAKQKGIQGEVTVEFTVMTDGSIANVKVLTGVETSLDNEAVRVISMSPKWTPGKHKNKAVKVIYRIPVIFY